MADTPVSIYLPPQHVRDIGPNRNGKMTVLKGSLANEPDGSQFRLLSWALVPKEPTMFFLNPSRRQFIQATAAVTASLGLPRNLFASATDHSFHFIHADTLNFWPVADPVRWSLDHAHEPCLERATEGLRKLTPDDGDRIIRLVVRRCRLNLLELRPGQVLVHHWGQHRADLRPFFKQHRLARPEVEVVLRDRKQEIVTAQTGDDFLFGDRLAADFPLDHFRSKWASRFTLQPDDWTPAPGTRSGYAWGSVEDQIPWIALKAAWRQATPLMCLNCDQPTILTNFGYPWTGLLNRSAKFIHVCGACRRSFRDESVKDVPAWMAANLEVEARPDSEMVWDRRVALGTEGRT